MTGDNSAELSLSVTIGDVAIQVSGPSDDAEEWFETLQKEYLDDIEDAAVEEAARGSQIANGGQNPLSESGEESQSEKNTGKTRSLAEFYKEVDNPTKQERALLVGWYLEKKEAGPDIFTLSDIREKANTAKIDIGENLSRDVRNQVGKGHMQKAGERDENDAYQVTLTGEEYVDEELLGRA